MTDDTEYATLSFQNVIKKTQSLGRVVQTGCGVINAFDRRDLLCA